MGVKYSVNEKFFDHWNPSMAYTLGFIYADGSLENAVYLRGKYLRLTSTDEEIIKKIHHCLKSKHPIRVIDPILKWRKKRYFLRIGSHKLYDALTKYGLCPNKSLTIQFPRVPQKYLSDFVRGYFDGDGCISLEKGIGKNDQLIVKRIKTAFTSGSKFFLDQLSNELSYKIGLRKKKVYSSHRSFQLTYSTADTVKLFKFMYKDSMSGICLQRKFEVFRSYFKLKPKKVDSHIRTILAVEKA